MSILLYRPGSASTISELGAIDLEPLELEYLYTVATALNRQAMIVDGMYDKRNLKSIIAKAQPKLVVITGYITQEQLMLDAAKMIKQSNQSIKIIVGGVHAQLNYERFYSPYVDCIVHSAALQPFKQIIQLAVDFNNDQLNTIDGLCYQHDNQWYKTATLRLNPNDLPIPNRDFFNTHKHHYRYLNYTPCAVVKSAYSCPYTCNFCYCKLLNGGHYATRDIDKVVAEISTIDCTYIHIVDDTFTADVQRILTFIRLIKQANINKKFIIYSRADFVVKHSDIVSQLAQIGVVGVIVGIEAVDDKQLVDYQKGVSKDVNHACIAILKQYNIDCLALFIISHQALKADFDYLYQWIEEADLSYATVSVFTPIPGTPLYEQYKDQLITDDITHWDFVHLVIQPTNMSVATFYRHYYQLITRLALLGKKRGAYQFMDWQYFKRLAETMFRKLMS